MPNFMEIPIYTATELGLTKATKALLAAKPDPFAYSTTDFDPPIRQDNKIVVKTYRKHRKSGVKKTTRPTPKSIERFLQSRIFTIIRNEGFCDRNAPA